LSAGRNAVWLVFAFVILVPRALDALWRPTGAARRPAVNVVLATAVAGCALAVAVASAARPASDYQQEFPAAAGRAGSAAAARDPRERVFANEKYADWLMWDDPRLAGRMAFDARFELLSAAEVRSIAVFGGMHGQDWRKPTDGFQILVLDDVEEQANVNALLAAGDARPVYRDGKVAVLVRR
jgi:hypothetical protein